MGLQFRPPSASDDEPVGVTAGRWRLGDQAELDEPVDTLVISGAALVGPDAGQVGFRRLYAERVLVGDRGEKVDDLGFAGTEFRGAHTARVPYSLAIRQAAVSRGAQSLDQFPDRF